MLEEVYKRQVQYELESTATVGDVIKLEGGLLPYADVESINTVSYTHLTLPTILRVASSLFRLPLRI